MKSQDEIAPLVTGTTVKEDELALAKQIIQSLAGSFDAGALRSEYRAKLRQLLEAKLEGHEVRPEAAAPTAEAPTVDLMAALRASVEAAAKSTSSVNDRATRTRATTAK